jgi:hypothetical protein
LRTARTATPIRFNLSLEGGRLPTLKNGGEI